MERWADFFVAQVGASSALAGLLFVALSINLTKILSFAGLPERALEVLTVLVGVLIDATLVLVPDQPVPLVGAELLVVGVVMWGLTTRTQYAAWKKIEPQYRRIYTPQLVIGQVAILMLMVAGIVVMVAGSVGLYLTVAGILLCYLVAITNTWVLLVEINR